MFTQCQRTNLSIPIIYLPSFYGYASEEMKGQGTRLRCAATGRRRRIPSQYRTRDAAQCLRNAAASGASLFAAHPEQRGAWIRHPGGGTAKKASCPVSGEECVNPLRDASRILLRKSAESPHYVEALRSPVATKCRRLPRRWDMNQKKARLAGGLFVSSDRSVYPLMAACAAARRAIGTRYGEQLT